jgi:hypothetical protein
LQKKGYEKRLAELQKRFIETKDPRYEGYYKSLEKSYQAYEFLYKNKKLTFAHAYALLLKTSLNLSREPNIEVATASNMFFELAVLDKDIGETAGILALVKEIPDFISQAVSFYTQNPVKKGYMGTIEGAEDMTINNISFTYNQTQALVHFLTRFPTIAYWGDTIQVSFQTLNQAFCQRWGLIIGSTEEKIKFDDVSESLTNAVLHDAVHAWRISGLPNVDSFLKGEAVHCVESVYDFFHQFYAFLGSGKKELTPEDEYMFFFLTHEIAIGSFRVKAWPMEKIGSDTKEAWEKGFDSYLDFMKKSAKRPFRALKGVQDWKKHFEVVYRGQSSNEAPCFISITPALGTLPEDARDFTCEAYFVLGTRTDNYRIRRSYNRSIEWVKDTTVFLGTLNPGGPLDSGASFDQQLTYIPGSYEILFSTFKERRVRAFFDSIRKGSLSKEEVTTH